MKFTKRLISALAGLTLAVQTMPFVPMSTIAETVDDVNYVTVLVDTSILGQDYFIQPTLVEYEEGDTAGTITEKLFNELGIEIEGDYSYITGIKGADTGVVNFPEWLMNDETFIENYEETNSDDVLGAYDYSSMSGWLYYVNDTSAWVGSSEYEIINEPDTAVDITSQANLCNGNVVIRWAFTVWGYGADLGYDGWGTQAMVDANDKTDLYSAMAYANYYGYAGTSYDTAYDIAIDFTSTEEEIATATKTLNDSIEAYINGNIKDIGYSIDTLEDGVSNYILSTVENPSVGSLGGEWSVIQLARSGNITEDFKNSYLENLKSTLIDCDGVLSTTKATEYARVILALSSLGYDASNFESYDLISPLADYDFAINQGLNGAVYSLLALDTCNYEISTCEDGKTQNSREKLVDYILSAQLEDGGWTFFGSTYDVDMTAMVLQALAPYYDSNVEVKSAVDKAIDLLSEVQCSDGGYASWGSENPCSTTQVLCALSILGIDSLKDTRFITDDGDTILSYLMNFAVVDDDNVSFKYQLDGSVDQMTTEQIGYSLTAYNRFLNGQTSLYDYSDLKQSEVTTTDDTEITTETSIETTTTSDEVTTTTDTTTTSDTVTTTDTTTSDTVTTTDTTTTSDTVTTIDTTTTSSSTSIDTTVTTTTTQVQVTLLGDINVDGSIKSNDLLLLKRYLLGLDDLDNQSLVNADATQDGDVKSNDLLILKKYLLGLVESF
ncbi:MAG: dockerin type I domain-containing protein [Ruminococcus sp.]|nr:dockerin type I domain-containing protein [Ruminococcus sp.]